MDRTFANLRSSIVGLGLTVIIVGGAFALAAFGRLLSMMSEGSFSLKSLILLLRQAALSALPLAFVFGLV